MYLVAGPGFEPGTEAYETSEMPFLYPAIALVDNTQSLIGLSEFLSGVRFSS